MKYRILMKRYLVRTRGNMKAAHAMIKQQYNLLEESGEWEEISRVSDNYQSVLIISFRYDSDRGTSYDLGIDVAIEMITSERLTIDEMKQVVADSLLEITETIISLDEKFAFVLSDEDTRIVIEPSSPTNQPTMRATGMWLEMFTWYKDLVRGTFSGSGRKVQKRRFITEV